MKTNKFFLNVDAEEIKCKLDRVQTSSGKLDVFVNSIVNQYCSELDKFISDIYTIVSNKEVDVPDVDIEYMVIQLPMLMYFTSSKLEEVGLREDVARTLEKEAYNNAYMISEGTVNTRESAAQMASQQEAVAAFIIGRAYRKIKSRLEFATETLGSLKKVIANRIADKDLANRGRQ